ncbi:hypothetical protein [Cytobacillus gottheilii]|nr:hypothetical protein [Cytobacillus gottheilii]
MKRTPVEEIKQNPEKFGKELLKRVKDRRKPQLKLIIGGKK